MLVIRIMMIYIQPLFNDNSILVEGKELNVENAQRYSQYRKRYIYLLIQYAVLYFFCHCLFPFHRPDFANIAKLKAVDVVAVRMFLNKKIKIPYPSNVGGGGLAPGLESTGLTFYDINALQVKQMLGGASHASD